MLWAIQLELFLMSNLKKKLPNSKEKNHVEVFFIKSLAYSIQIY